MSEQGDYRVNLDIYNGPLDLLLYLIRRDELDIHDIPIARITEQYLAYVEMLKKLDPNLAGEFLVMAAALVEIKSRMLLPAREAEEGESEDLALDPREELVRQLLEYKAFKDAAHDLSDAADIQAQRFPRRPAGFEPETEKDTELEDLQIWDLFDAFRNVLDAIGQMSAHHEVIVDDTPQELYREDLLDRIRRDGALPFSRIFEGRSTRGEIIGLFLALLELCKLRRLRAYQPESFSEIQIDLRDDADADLDADDPADDTPPADTPPSNTPPSDDASFSGDQNDRPDNNTDTSSFSGGRNDRPDNNTDASSFSGGRNDRPDDNTDASSFSGGRNDRPDDEFEPVEAFEPPTGDEVKSTRYVREVDEDDNEPEDILAADREARDELEAIPEVDIDERLAEYEAAREARKQAGEELDEDDELEDDEFENDPDEEDDGFEDDDNDDDDASSFSGGRHDRPEQDSEKNFDDEGNHNTENDGFNEGASSFSGGRHDRPDDDEDFDDGEDGDEHA